jgi:hypothetical protein
MANKSLTQVADTLATLGYMISMEGEDIAAEDLYAMAGDLENSIASLLAAAKQKENENA